MIKYVHLHKLQINVLLHGIFWCPFSNSSQKMKIIREFRLADSKKTCEIKYRLHIYLFIRSHIYLLCLTERSYQLF